MGFTFTHATLKLLTAGAIASWFSFGMRLLKSSVGTKDHTAHRTCYFRARTYDWPVADTQRIYLWAFGRASAPAKIVSIMALMVEQIHLES